MTDDFSDLPLHDDASGFSGIAFDVDTHPSPRPRETSPVKRLLSALFDLLITALIFLALLLIVRVSFPSGPWTPHLFATVVEALILSGIAMLLGVFFWGNTAGMLLFRLTVVDREHELPDARTTLLWFGHHLLACLTLGIYGPVYQHIVIDKPFFVIDRSS